VFRDAFSAEAFPLAILKREAAEKHPNRFALVETEMEISLYASPFPSSSLKKNGLTAETAETAEE